MASEAKIVDIVETDATKVCSCCGENKPTNNYYKHNNQCKVCLHKKELARKKNFVEDPEKLKEAKTCKYCDVEKTGADFVKNSLRCRDCERALGREYRRGDYGKAKAKLWADENPERMQELRATWYVEHKDEINKKYAARCKEDVYFKMRRAYKGKTLTALMGSGRANKNYAFLNCHPKFFKDWFNHCFDEHMTMENQGVYWHVDHVIPVHTFDMHDPLQVELCFSWYNTSPLNGTENLTKNKYIDKKQLATHYDKLKKFTNGIIKTEYEKLILQYLKQDDEEKKDN